MPIELRRLINAALVTTSVFAPGLQARPPDIFLNHKPVDQRTTILASHSPIRPWLSDTEVQSTELGNTAVFLDSLAQAMSFKGNMRLEVDPILYWDKYDLNNVFGIYADSFRIVSSDWNFEIPPNNFSEMVVRVIPDSNGMLFMTKNRNEILFHVPYIDSLHQVKAYSFYDTSKLLYKTKYGSTNMPHEHILEEAFAVFADWYYNLGFSGGDAANFYNVQDTIDYLLNQRARVVVNPEEEGVVKSNYPSVVAFYSRQSTQNKGNSQELESFEETTLLESYVVDIFIKKMFDDLKKDGRVSRSDIRTAMQKVFEFADQQRRTETGSGNEVAEILEMCEKQGLIGKPVKGGSRSVVVVDSVNLKSNTIFTIAGYSYDHPVNLMTSNVTVSYQSTDGSGALQSIPYSSETLENGMLKITVPGSFYNDDAVQTIVVAVDYSDGSRETFKLKYFPVHRKMTNQVDRFPLTKPTGLYNGHQFIGRSDKKSHHFS